MKIIIPVTSLIILVFFNHAIQSSFQMKNILRFFKCSRPSISSPPNEPQCLEECMERERVQERIFLQNSRILEGIREEPENSAVGRASNNRKSVIIKRRSVRNSGPGISSRDSFEDLGRFSSNDPDSNFHFVASQSNLNIPSSNNDIHSRRFSDVDQYRCLPSQNGNCRRKSHFNPNQSARMNPASNLLDSSNGDSQRINSRRVKSERITRASNILDSNIRHSRPYLDGDSSRRRNPSTSRRYEYQFQQLANRSPSIAERKSFSGVHRTGTSPEIHLHETQTSQRKSRPVLSVRAEVSELSKDRQQSRSEGRFTPSHSAQRGSGTPMHTTPRRAPNSEPHSMQKSVGNGFAFNTMSPLYPKPRPWTLTQRITNKFNGRKDNTRR